ncbi:unnamed protein product [Euphydryas editha]|uniref:Reverse transcriptase n=1 Tax=Euphydryas editha TaxID=104508 RepID=A0AAU9VE44_EUPED|nr:unnamed protein product [Euphydryas editha]
MSHKPEKPALETSSYRPISLTLVLSKPFPSVLTNVINIIPLHQFSFRKHHSALEQVHRVHHSSMLGNSCIISLPTIYHSQRTSLLLPTLMMLPSFHLLWTQQEQLNYNHAWLNKWRIKASAPKSFHITFSQRQSDCSPVKLDNTILRQTNCIKNLGFLLDRCLTWKDHIKPKRDETKQQFRNLLWLLGKQSTLSFYYQLLVYSTILKPIWIYGIQIWSPKSTQQNSA